MSFASFGIGAGAFANGLSRGMGMGTQFKQARNEREIEAIRREGLADAKKRREKTISGNMEQMSVAGSDGMWKVGEGVYTDKEKARGAASQGAPSQEDLFIQNTVPKLRDAYLAQGNTEKARAFDTWAQERKNQAAMKEWSSAYLSMQRGDWDKAAQQAGAFYNQHIDDGVEYVGHEAMTDGDGNVTGFKMKLKDKNTGKVTETPMDRQAMVSLVQANNPQAMFESESQRMASANEARVDMARGDREAARDHRYNLDEITHREQAQAQYSGGADQPADVRTAEWLIQNGVARNPQEAWQLTNMATTAGRQDFAMQYAEMLTSGQSEYSQDKKTPEQAIQEGLRLYDTLQEAQTQQPQVQGGGQGGGQQRPAQGGLPVLDTQTGQLIYR